MSESNGLDPRELQSRALRGVSWSSLATTVSLPLSILVSVVVARTLGVSGFADFAVLSFVVPLLYAVIDLGYAQATAREASRAYAAGDLDGTRALLRKSVGWSLLRLPVVAVVTLLVARPSLLVGAVLLAYLIVVHALAGFNFALNAENRGATLAKLALFQTVVSGAATIATALAGASATAVWAASLAAGAVAAPGWALAADRRLRRAAVTPALPRALPAGFWRFAVAAIATTGVSMLVFSRSEVLLLNVLADDAAVAVFALAFGLAQRLTTPVDTLLGPLTSALSALEGAHPERLRAGFERSLRLASLACAVLSGVALAATAFAAPVLFGPEYEGVGAAFAVLAVISLMRAVAQPYTAVAYARGRPGSVFRALVVALGVDVAVALALIPVLGLWGAVAANAAGGAVAIVLTARAAVGRGTIARAGVRVWRLLGVAVGAAALSWVAGLAAAEVNPLAGAAAALAVGATATLLLLRTSGGVVAQGDVDALMRVLPARLRVERAAGALVAAE